MNGEVPVAFSYPDTEDDETMAVVSIVWLLVENVLFLIDLKVYKKHVWIIFLF